MKAKIHQEVPDGRKNTHFRKNGKDRTVQYRQLLQEAFQAPPPLGKASFLRSIRPKTRSRVSTGRFVLQQAAYIRKWVWALSAGVFLGALAGGRFLGGEVLWMLSAAMPLLAVSAVMEYMRSEVWGMTELEMAARFCLKSILLARIGALGAVHLVTLMLLSLLCRWEGITLLRIGLCLLGPYLLTDAAALWLIRKIRGREAVYLCLGLAVMVGILPLLAGYGGAGFRIPEDSRGWTTVLLLLGAAAAWGWKKNIERTEELTWS